MICHNIILSPLSGMFQNNMKWCVSCCNSGHSVGMVFISVQLYGSVFVSIYAISKPNADGESNFLDALSSLDLTLVSQGGASVLGALKILALPRLACPPHPNPGTLVDFTTIDSKK